jgi:hypothetical protein
MGPAGSPRGWSTSRTERPRNLLKGLGYAGGGSTLTEAAQTLLKVGTHTLLSASHPQVVYPLTAAQVRDQVNAALASKEIPTILSAASSLQSLDAVKYWKTETTGGGESFGGGSGGGGSGIKMDLSDPTAEIVIASPAGPAAGYARGDEGVPPPALDDPARDVPAAAELADPYTPIRVDPVGPVGEVFGGWPEGTD